MNKIYNKIIMTIEGFQDCWKCRNWNSEKQITRDHNELINNTMYYKS